MLAIGKRRENDYIRHGNACGCVSSRRRGAQQTDLSRGTTERKDSPRRPPRRPAHGGRRRGKDTKARSFCSASSAQSAGSLPAGLWRDGHLCGETVSCTCSKGAYTVSIRSGRARRARSGKQAKPRSLSSASPGVLCALGVLCGQSFRFVCSKGANRLDF